MMRRLAPLLLGVAAAGAVLPFVIGGGPRVFIFMVPILGGLAAVALRGSRHTTTPEPGWSGPVRPLDLELRAGRPARTSRSRGGSRQVAVALARVEARELARSLWFAVGVGFLVVTFLLFIVVYGASNGEHWADTVALAPWFAHPLVGMVVLAAHRDATRPRRDGTDELFDTCPASPATRTWGVAGSAWVPVSALVVFFVAYGAAASIRSSNLYGSPGSDAIPMLLAALLLGAGGVVLGVALGQWVHFALAPVVAVVAVGFVSLKLATIGDPGWNPLQQLSTFPPISDLSPAFTDAPAWSHLGWIATLTGGVLLAAIARHRRDRSIAILGVATCLLLAGTAAASTRAMPGSSAHRIAQRIAAPADHQTCRAAASMQVCVYRGNEELGARVATEITPVASSLPGRSSPVTLRQRFPGTVDDLPPEVARLLPEGVPPVPSREVNPGYSASPEALRRVRPLVGLVAVGLPGETDRAQGPLPVAGQARGVVALWLATRGLDADDAGRLTSSRTVDQHDCGEWPVIWSAQDLVAARVMATLPEATVRAVVHGGWERWTDPTTGTNDLLAAVGLGPIGPFDPVGDHSLSPC